MAPRPIVLEDIKLDTLVQLLLDQHAANSTLLICTTRDAFIQDLLRATKPTNSTSITGTSPHPLLTNTLQLIAQSRTLQLAFCPSLDVVRAWLSKYTPSNNSVSQNPHHATGQPLLAVLGLVDAHRETSSWSAQGLSRTLAIAVDATHQAGQRLVIAECLAVGRGDDETFAEQQPGFGEAEGDDAGVRFEEGETPARQAVWNEQVAILNVATKSFGAGERGWVGRTVKIRKVMERWCEFKKVQINSSSELA